MELTLTRYARARQTLGILRASDGGEQTFWCCTLELPWVGNERRESCIPPAPNGEAAEYRVEHRDPGEWSSFQYPHLRLRGVADRDYILIHRGNFVSDTAGCILVGQSFAGDINGDGLNDVTSSTETLQRLVDVVPDGGCSLWVQWANVSDISRMVADDPELSVDDLIADADLTGMGVSA